MKSCKIINVSPDSIADRLGIKAGYQLKAINGQELTDIIDYSFAVTEKSLVITVENLSGETVNYKVRKEYDEGLGLEFESAVFDGIRACGNRCPFCFVEQVPPNMRSSLYIKDDDYRMSFLYGNFITLTNIREDDLRRIARLHLSPLFISVHTMNMDLRTELLHTKRAGLLLQQLDTLEEAGIDYHTQIVLCPGINDGKELDFTLEALIARRPSVQSVAIVPVGLTKYREKCVPLQMFNADNAKIVIEQVSKYQQKMREESDESFIYLGDEFYFLAGEALPAADEYDGFPQLDNGIGLARNFIDDWHDCSINKVKNGYAKELKLLVVAGSSFAQVLEELCGKLKFENLFVKVLPVKNDFFGHTVNVSGLLTGQDIKKSILSVLKSEQYDGVVIPASAIRAGENIFLDDYSLEQLQTELELPVKTVLTGSDLYNLLTDWYQNSLDNNEAKMYTWQSNAAYTQVRGGTEHE